MTSLKRGLVAEGEDTNPSASLTSVSSSQRSRFISPDNVSQEASYRDRGWNQLWNELIGVPQIEYAANNLALNGDERAESDFDVISTKEVEGNVEFWMTEKICRGYDANDTSFYASFDKEAVQGDSDDGGDFSICYGMIYRARCRLRGNMAEVSRSLQGSGVPCVRSHLLLDVFCNNGQLLMAVPNGPLIAQLNEQLNESLVALVEARTIRLMALVNKRNILDDISAATRAGEAHTNVNINVYGSGSSLVDVGRRLSTHKVWLQRPDWYEPQCNYRNPHFLNFEDPLGNKDSDELVDGSLLTESAALEDSLIEVYSMLTRDTQLKGIAGDERLKTKLLPHQEKGLDFMIQREKGPVPAKYQLWREVVHKGETWFHHGVADIKSKTLPSETGGGIIADEMGMGKTFSMVALIVRTLEDAGLWVSDTETHIEEGIAPTKRLSRATLVVVPTPLLLKTWTDEIENRLHVNIRILIYHGNGRPQNVNVVGNHDVVLTTYHTLLADHNRTEKDKRWQGIIRDIAWYRIILDEAHFIRSPTTHLHKRVAELDAKFRWCLTGTPIQNRLEDVGALFAFLRISPFDHLGLFRKRVSGPFSEGGSGKLLAQQNLAKLLDSFCVRRTKVLLNLEDMTQLTRYVDFTLEEQMQYDKSNEDMKRAMQNIVGNSQDNSRFGMFQAQLQGRLLCNHGTFQHQFHWVKSRLDIDMREDALAFAGRTVEISCSACTQEIPLMDLGSAYKLQTLCMHILCSECQEEGGDQCPLCELARSQRSNGRSNEAGAPPQSREGYFRPTGHSSKMIALMQDLQDAKPTDKSIVFSHWTTTLDLIGRHLREYRKRFARIDGNDNFRQRQRVLEEFRNEADLPVLIMTTGVGAFGLDLTAANRVFLVEPQWNPSVELQAIGRTMRIGQKKMVTVMRYIMRNTVEMDMQQLQKRKLKMVGVATIAGTADGAPKVKDEPQR